MGKLMLLATALTSPMDQCSHNAQRPFCPCAGLAERPCSFWSSFLDTLKDPEQPLGISVHPASCTSFKLAVWRAVAARLAELCDDSYTDDEDNNDHGSRFLGADFPKWAELLQHMLVAPFDLLRAAASGTLEARVSISVGSC